MFMWRLAAPYIFSFLFSRCHPDATFRETFHCCSVKINFFFFFREHLFLLKHNIVFRFQTQKFRFWQRSRQQTLSGGKWTIQDRTELDSLGSSREPLYKCGYILWVQFHLKLRSLHSTGGWRSCPSSSFHRLSLVCWQNASCDSLIHFRQSY